MHNRCLRRFVLPACTAVLISSVLLLVGCNEHKPPLRLGVTTTLDDSGLLQRLTADFYHQRGIAVAPIVAGSGQLFTLIKRGDVDIAITHDPQGEKHLVAQGLISSRQALFYNYFVIVGSKKDPANIAQATSTADAFTRLINSNSLYVSRNDNSGTHRMEQYWWSQAQAHSSQRSPNNVLLTGTGMGATLTVAVNKNAYTLVDLGTWRAFNNKQQLQVLWRDSKALRNDYHLLTLNPNRIRQTNRAQPSSVEASSQKREVAIFTQWIHQWANATLQHHQPTEAENTDMYLNKMPFFMDKILQNTPKE
jgi:tungstate transport system substrate-binding protein